MYVCVCVCMFMCMHTYKRSTPTQQLTIPWSSLLQ